MEETLEKIKKIINESKSFAIVCEKEAPEHIFLLKEALAFYLYQKKFAVVTLPQMPEDFLKKWNSILAPYNQTTERKTLIRVPKEHCQIKEISYEDNESSTIITMSLKKGKLTKETLIVEEMPFEADSVFCFAQNQEVLSSYKNQITLPNEERVILLTKNEQLATEKVYNLIFGNGYQMPPSLATLLLASLIKETSHFSQPFLQEKNFSLAAGFLKAGAEKEKISAILNEEKNIPFLQLLGRALSRTQNNEALKSSWTFLIKKDFEKTNIDPSQNLLEKLAKEIRNNIPKKPFQILLWQGPSQNEAKNGIRAFIFSEEENRLSKLAGLLGAKIKSEFLITDEFSSFSEVEIKLRQLLKDLI